MSFRQNLNVTELDFENIKANMAAYFSSNPKFSDWNFAGSGLNILLDVLAYNTHYNAITAHMNISESYIDSAQLRQNVVSLAKLLSYTPRSVISPTATVNITFTAERSDSVESFTLPKGTVFAAETKSKPHLFVTEDAHTFVKDINGKYTVNGITLRQGYYVTNRFQVDNVRNTDIINYEIEDSAIDASSLIVKVFSSAASTVPEIYTKLEDEIAGVNENSRIYFLSENINGKYQISFGNNVFGKKPKNRSVVQLEYLVSSGSVANGARTFTMSSTVPASIKATPTITTVAAATAGSDQESVESIRYNAPLSFVTQNRAVTADDYRNLILRNFPFVQTVSVWGGEDAVPPVYGKVFISIKPFGSDFLNGTQRKQIMDFIKNKKVLSIIPEFDDPSYVKLTLDVFFKYNSNLISLSRGQIEAGIRAVIKKYNDERLAAFDGVFRYSALSKVIDSYHPAILNSHVRVFASKSLTITANQPAKATVYFGTELTTDDDKVIISSSSWNFGGKTLYLGDADSGTVGIRKIHTYYFKNGVKTIVDSNVGTLDMKKGILRLNELGTTVTTTVTLDVMPNSNDIVPKQNQLLSIDMNRLYVKGEIDVIAVGGQSRAPEYNTFQRDR